MRLHDERLDEDKEYEECIVNTPTTVETESFIKLPTRLMRNRFYQQWRCTKRASTAEFLFGFTIRKRCGNAIADLLYNKYYVEKKLLVARFTHQGLAERLGYKDRRGINNHMVELEKENIFTVHEEPWRDRSIRVYEFGTWDNKTGNDYFEIVHMYTKFNKMLATYAIEKKFSK